MENIVKDALGDKAYEPEKSQASQFFHTHPTELSSVDDVMSDDQNTLFASSLSSDDQASLAPTPVSSQTVTPEPNLACYNPMDIQCYARLHQWLPSCHS